MRDHLGSQLQQGHLPHPDQCPGENPRLHTLQTSQSYFQPLQSEVLSLQNSSEDSPDLVRCEVTVVERGPLQPHCGPGEELRRDGWEIWPTEIERGHTAPSLHHQPYYGAQLPGREVQLTENSTNMTESRTPPPRREILLAESDRGPGPEPTRSGESFGNGSFTENNILSKAVAVVNR